MGEISPEEERGKEVEALLSECPRCSLSLFVPSILSTPTLSQRSFRASNGRGRGERPAGRGSRGRSRPQEQRVEPGISLTSQWSASTMEARLSLLMAAAVAALLVCPAASWGARKRATSVLFEKFDARDAVIDPCYEDSGGGGSNGGGGKKAQKPRSCVPEFTNAAYGVRVEATSTCGEVEREFCSTTPGSKNEGGTVPAGIRYLFLSFFGWVCCQSYHA